jgi:hypothetical protein
MIARYRIEMARNHAAACGYEAEPALLRYRLLYGDDGYHALLVIGQVSATSTRR